MNYIEIEQAFFGFSAQKDVIALGVKMAFLAIYTQLVLSPRLFHLNRDFHVGALSSTSLQHFAL